MWFCANTSMQLKSSIHPPLALRTLLMAAVVWPTTAFGAHVADTLVISEVGYDGITEPSNGASGEFIELHNPTAEDIVLNSGAEPGVANGLGSYFISDSPTNYYEVVNGAVALSATSDFVLQFPADTVIPAHGTLVICGDSDAFLGDFFSGNINLFNNLPGSPQLLEAAQDGTSDGVPDMIVRATYGSTPGNYLSLTNSGEPAILFHWDGQSDLVQDVDIVLWRNASQMPNKTGIAVDGPDGDGDASTYADDAASGTQAGSAPSSNTYSLQRLNISESGESDSGGNGLTGQDETSETFTDSSTFAYVSYNPGRQRVQVDGDVSDAVSFLKPMAVSAADGPNGEGNPADYGADGTLTELYLTTVDLDGNNIAESLYFMVRGSLFGEPDAATNAHVVLFDVDPGASTGVTTLTGLGNELSDIGGALDATITLSGVTLDGGFTSVGFDAAAGIDVAVPANFEQVGWRSWGTGSTTGAYANFAYLGEQTDVQFDGNLASVYPAAAGATYAATDGFEGALPLSTLTPTGIPEYLLAVAITTAGNGSSVSPNTLPESSSDSFDFPHTIDQTLCFNIASNAAVVYYDDLDEDGIGSTTPSSYCGPPIAGVALVTGDCDDTRADAAPGLEEVCDGIDNNCDGVTDEGLLTDYYGDLDGDGYGDPGSLVSECTQPTDYVANADDCDDTDFTVNPDGVEVCDNQDNDCSGAIDDGIPYYTYYLDGDGDGYGAGDAITDCNIPTGNVETKGDCDDTDAAINPGAEEVCDGIDNNCSGAADDGLPLYTFYLDGDGDGYGAGSSSTDCLVPDGYVEADGDCDDTDATLSPGAEEVCDGIDNNCDLAIDEGVIVTSYLDNDGDGFGTDTTTEACTTPDGYAASTGDCNDEDPAINPDAPELCDNLDNNCDGAVSEGELDGDGDGYRGCDGDCDDGNPAVNPGASEVCDGLDTNCDGTLPISEADDDNDGYFYCNGDCNDIDGDTYPGAEEVCDTRDNDCDLSIDEDVKQTFYRDQDGDGYGVSDTTVNACTAPTGYAAVDGDCNDSEPTANPGAPEICDGLDNNCNGQTNEGLDTTYYIDADGDGHGSTEGTVVDCEVPSGYSATSDDCDDTDPVIYGGAEEVCDYKDNNCDGQIDELGQTTYYPDQDGDGFGVDVDTVESCGAQEGYASMGGDCNDQDQTINPDAIEVCDGVDNNCDDAIDEAVTLTFYQDQDGDGFGTDQTQEACAAGEGWSAETDDCDDTNPSTYPGADELCDGADNNCDGEIDEGAFTTFYPDADGDAYGSGDPIDACEPPDGYAASNDDCDDTNADIYPGAPELCDGLDNDCDEVVDDHAGDSYWLDLDGDTYGAGESTISCEVLDGYVTLDGDCDDTDAAINPDAEELCDGKDNNCDGATDEGFGELTSWYLDSDGDGYGSAETLAACVQPEGYASTNDDCDDGNPQVFPGTEEICDGLDTNCDGALGEGEVDNDGDGSMLCLGDCDDGNPDINPQVPEACDGLDTDCNPATDENDDGDGDGVSACDGDCDDGDDAIYPGQLEACDGVDNDCDEQTDETVDGDGDGLSSCDGDCNDGDPQTHPGADEACNNLDDNCDGEVDEGFNTDADGDGYVAAECGGLDCNDSDSSFNPGEEEIPNDGIDQDCSGADAIDLDLDGYEADVDCDDEDPEIHPAEAETACNDLKDNDCDGFRDLQDADCSTDPTDSDNDGLTDIQETAFGTDPNDPDSDDDGLTDGEEIDLLTNPNRADTDNDGLDDGEEVLTYETDPREADTDGDGLEDGDELTYGADPLVQDTDGDGLLDGDEVYHATEPTDPTVTDTDGDGISDDVEVAEDCALQAGLPDSDEDGLTDGEESTNGDCFQDAGETDPLDADTDNDGLSDGEEVNSQQTDPLNGDTDGDGYSDGEEVAAGTNPLVPDAPTENDGTTPPGDDGTNLPGDDDTSLPGDDDTQPIGDDDTQPLGDDDTQPLGDDDTQPSGDDDSATPGAGDDDDSGGSCQCSNLQDEQPMPTGAALMGLLGLFYMLRRRRN